MPSCMCLVALLGIVSLSVSADENDGENAPSDSDVIRQAVAHILAKQEGENNAEWPYEGVYRVRGEIPIGYRVGGTAICAMAMLQAPGYADDPERTSAVRRALEFVLSQVGHPLMSPNYDGGYDVRGWGYTYGLAFLLKAKQFAAIPDELTDSAEKAIAFYLSAIEQIEIPQCGGWSYSRRAIDSVSPPSPFMTAPTLQVLFEAHAMGMRVNRELVERGLKTLEQARTPTGSIRYSGLNGDKSAESVPGSVGRMLAAESTLFLAERSDVSRVRGALDAFVVHWEWLEKRRRQQGTHVPPYGIAPYYFFYAHFYAAQAIELLPIHERSEYRRRLSGLLMSVRSPDGSWNDRVFERSSNYGTAMALMALLAPHTNPPARWKAADVGDPEAEFPREE